MKRLAFLTLVAASVVLPACSAAPPGTGQGDDATSDLAQGEGTTGTDSFAEGEGDFGAATAALEGPATTNGGTSGSLPFGPIQLPTIVLPNQTVGPMGRIDVASSITCSVSGAIAYSVSNSGGRYVVSATPSAQVVCDAVAHAQRRGFLFRPTADGGVTISVDVSATATVTGPTTLDCANPGGWKPTVTVKLRAQLAISDVWVVVRGRRGRVRPILTRIANRLAPAAAAQLLADAQREIDAKLAQWEAQANAAIAARIPALPAAICNQLVPPVDAGVSPVIDSGIVFPVPDAGTVPVIDAGVPPVIDSGVVVVDADSGVAPDADAGVLVPTEDAGVDVDAVDAKAVPVVDSP
ncbi:MAG: hypothetical protein U0169_18400 [Polyangiaceae bacterium]